MPQGGRGCCYIGAHHHKVGDGRLQSLARLKHNSINLHFTQLPSELRFTSMGYLAFAAANLRPTPAPIDKRPTRPIRGKGLAVVGNVGGSGASADTANTSAISTSSSVGFCAFKGAWLIATMWGALTVAAGFIVFAANSAGIDGTGVLFALANAVAFGFGYTKSRP